MTVIRITCNRETRNDHRKEFLLLVRRLSLVPMVILGSKRVQMEVHVLDDPIKQFIMDSVDRPSGATNSNIVLHTLHVENATSKDNDLVAKATLAVIWGTLSPELLIRPNSFVQQNVSVDYGWTEGLISPRDAERVVRLLDSYWTRGSLPKSVHIALKTVFPD